MKRTILAAIACVAVPFLLEAEPEARQPNTCTLTGVLHHYVKAITPSYLEIDGGGRLKLSGTKTGKIEEGTRVLVRGTIKTKLHAPPAGSSPFPTQWVVSMWVDEVQIIDKPFGGLIQNRRKEDQEK